MLKKCAIELLGGTVSAASKAIGITYQAVDKWPDVLTPALRDRVQAALYRQHCDSASIDTQPATLAPAGSDIATAAAGQGA